MQSKTHIALFIGIVILLSLSCNTAFLPERTSTTEEIVQVTSSPTLTQTASPIPTISSPRNTPVPTAIPGYIPDPDAVVLTRETYTIENSGFSFDSLIGYKMEISDRGVSITDPYSTIFMLLVKFLDEPDNITVDDVLYTFLSAFSDRFDTQFDESKPYRIMIDGVEGIEYKIRSDDDIYIGQIFIIDKDPGDFFVGYCVSMNLIFPDRWDSEAKRQFDKLKSSIKFLS